MQVDNRQLCRQNLVGNRCDSDLYDTDYHDANYCETDYCETDYCETDYCETDYCETDYCETASCNTDGHLNRCLTRLPTSDFIQEHMRGKSNGKNR